MIVSNLKTTYAKNLGYNCYFKDISAHVRVRENVKKINALCGSIVQNCFISIVVGNFFHNTQERLSMSRRSRFPN